ncbi:hypothetical protein KSF_072490 [Reticulibacter mediterranei]|uniref:VCBS repeat-containing protein n=1 Tax=Reticulibacter mediterranei TaxID=2778369 RepID=A0A8J3IW24_9CHLR|nr:hypothetical protein [Reticulibacter mediterranei]GHO97201.1 hypothetical protein KSF_072490 [Reticulibacter mediterranei]
MPVLATTDEQQIVPRSILRRRPSSKKAAHNGGKQKADKSPFFPPLVQRASRSPAKETEEPVSEWKRSAETQKIVPGKGPITGSFDKLFGHTTGKVHPLFYLVLGMLVMFTVWLIITTAINWTTTALDDLHYGRPRTFQTDAWVQHNEQSGHPSHFIAINLHRHIQVIEFPGGDTAHPHIYNGPQLYGANDDLAIVTLTFADVNGDHLPDMIINIQSSRVVFINEKGTFRPLQPNERPQVEQFLQHMHP